MLLTGLNHVWDSEIAFRLRIERDERSSIIVRYLQALTLLKYISLISLLIYSGFHLGRTYVELNNNNNNNDNNNNNNNGLLGVHPTGGFSPPNA